MTGTNSQKVLIALLIAGSSAIAVCCGGCGMLLIISNRAQNAAEQALLDGMTDLEREYYQVEKKAKQSSVFVEGDAERAVKNVLKSPSGADFTSFPRVAMLGPNGYSVTGQVESVNSFNARITEEYFVVLYRNDPADLGAKPVWVQVGKFSKCLDQNLYDQCMKEAEAFKQKHSKP